MEAATTTRKQPSTRTFSPSKDEHDEAAEIGGEVDLLPGAAADLRAEVRRNHDHQKGVEAEGSEVVVQGLAGRVDGEEQVGDGEFRSGVEEQQGGMDEEEHERGVGRPIMEAEESEGQFGAGPAARGVVVAGDEYADHDIEREQHHGGKAGEVREIEHGHSEGIVKTIAGPRSYPTLQFYPQPAGAR
jgi:hypothetical protein